MPARVPKPHRHATRNQLAEHFLHSKTGGAKDSGGSDESENVITPALRASWSAEGASVPQETEEISSY